MRSTVRDRQTVYLTHVTEGRDGIDTIWTYSRPVEYKLTVSKTGGLPKEIYPGVLPDYDRYITSYEWRFDPDEGDLLYVDVLPELDANGDIVTDANGVPTVSPDYVVVRKIGSQKTPVQRFGIKCITGDRNA